MGFSRDEPSKWIVLKLLVLAVLYYASAFIIEAILSAGFDLRYDGRLPFEFKEFGFTSRYALASWLNIVITDVVFSGITFVVIRNWRTVWDYVGTLSALHFVISCLVMLDFPKNWVWWVTFLGFKIAITLVSMLFCLIYELLRIRFAAIGQIKS